MRIRLLWQWTDTIWSLSASSISLPFLLQKGSRQDSVGSACCGRTVAPASVFCLPKFSAVSLFSWLSVLICLCFLQSSKFWQILLLTLAKRMKWQHGHITLDNVQNHNVSKIWGHIFCHVVLGDFFWPRQLCPPSVSSYAAPPAICPPTHGSCSTKET